jgi:membrane associated rhomboid family serine protease
MTITLYLLAATCIVSFLAFRNDEMRERFIFHPYIIREQKQWYRFISSGFIHADWMHLLVNMFVFYMFGTAVEGYFSSVFEERGPFNYFLLYFGGLAVSTIRTYHKHKFDTGYRALGASGAVSAVVFSYIVFNPLENLCLYGILCMPGIIFGAAYLIYCYYAGKRGLGFVNHDAHMWGALFGFFFTILLKPYLAIYFLKQLPFLQNAF